VATRKLVGAPRCEIPELRRAKSGVPLDHTTQELTAVGLLATFESVMLTVEEPPELWRVPDSQLRRAHRRKAERDDIFGAAGALSPRL